MANNPKTRYQPISPLKEQKFQEQLIECPMKMYLYFILLQLVSLFGCKISKNIIQSTYKEDKIKINFKRNDFPATSFTGNVTDFKSKETISFAEIVLRNVDSGKYFGVRTDMNGKFTIKNLELGGYRLSIKAAGYQNIDIGFKVEFHANCTAEIKLDEYLIQVEKPVIYLYPNQKQNIQVQLNYAGTLTHTCPTYPVAGWNVTS